MNSMRFLLFFIVFSCLNTLVAQVDLSANTRADLSLIEKDYKFNNGQSSAAIKNRFAVYSFNQVDYFGALAKISDDYNPSQLTTMGIIVGSKINSIVSLKIPVSQINNIEVLPGLSFLQLAGKIKPELDKAIKDIGADSVHLGINLPQGYTGKDVFIGITDWGFDYTSPMFYDTLLQETRIHAAWDQFKTSGPHPNGFTYGTEYTTPTTLLAAGSDTANIYSFATHGSHVAGIAGGSGAGTIYRGVGFESKFLFATFLVDESAVMDAWAWMYQKAQEASKRLVINMSWGLYHFGTLDGNSLLSQAIDNYSAQGVLFANSGGNNGDVNFHIKKDFQNDTIKSKINFYSYTANPNMWGQSIHAWGEVGKSFSSGLIVYDQNGILAASTPLYSTDVLSSYIDSFLVVGLDTIYFNVSADAAHPQNGRPQMRIRVKSLSATNKVLLKSTAQDGIVHYWNVTELSNDVGNWGMPFATFGTGSIAGDKLYGISEPSCTNSLLSVAAYTPRYYNSSGTALGGIIAPFSSVGPRYDEVLKPEIAAPGVNIVSSISSYTDNSFTQFSSISFNNRTYPFARFSGTSMASPMVAGVIALVLEANPYLSAAQVKDIIIQSAREDAQTGVIPVNGSSQWGWGKINAYLAVKLALNTIGFEEVEQETLWTVYPNPVMQQLHFTVVDELPSTIQIISTLGTVIAKKVNTASIDVSDLKAGSYWVRVELNGRIQQQQFIKL
jgi:subtilisin family serine protease